MKKISILVAIGVIALTQIVSAQLYSELSSESAGMGKPRPIGDPSEQTHTQHISFDDTVGPGNTGTYNSTDTFSLDLYLTFAGYGAYGLSLWFETTADAAPHIFLTAFTIGTTFVDHGNAGGFPIPFTLFQSTGVYTTPDPSSFGSSLPGNAPAVDPGTYFVGHLSVSLSGLAPGIYTLQTDATNPHSSIVTSFDGEFFMDNSLPVASYTINVVPEPSTFALLIIAAIGFGAATYRRALSKKLKPKDFDAACSILFFYRTVAVIFRR